MVSNSSHTQDISRVNAIVPLALLRTLQQLDRTDPVDLEEYAEEVAPKRFGISRTVSAQIDRHAKLVKRGAFVDTDEVVQLFRLVGRRKDAQLAFSHAGRLAAEEILQHTSVAARLVHRAGQVVARERVNLALALRLAGRLLHVALTLDKSGGVVAVADGPLTAAAPEGKPCEFFGAALAELLRKCTAFEGAMLHQECRSRGDAACLWHSGSINGS